MHGRGGHKDHHLFFTEMSDLLIWYRDTRGQSLGGDTYHASQWSCDNVDETNTDRDMTINLFP